MVNKFSKKAQEEMVGFALIAVIVAVVLIVFLSFILRNPQTQVVQSYEVQSFIQSFLQYTTNCTQNSNTESVQDLIFLCDNSKMCDDGRNSCNVLNQTLIGIINQSWVTGNNRPIKGYELGVNSSNNTLFKLSFGNKTANLQGSSQFLPQNTQIYFTSYS